MTDERFGEVLVSMPDNEEFFVLGHFDGYEELHYTSLSGNPQVVKPRRPGWAVLRLMVIGRETFFFWYDHEIGHAVQWKEA